MNEGVFLYYVKNMLKNVVKMENGGNVFENIFFRDF